MPANLIIGATMSPSLGGRLPSRRPQKGPTLCICLGLRTYSSVGLSQPVYVQFKYTNLKTVSQQRVDNNSNETRLTNFRHFSELLRMNVDTDAEAKKLLPGVKKEKQKNRQFIIVVIGSGSTSNVPTLPSWWAADKEETRKIPLTCSAPVATLAEPKVRGDGNGSAFR